VVGRPPAIKPADLPIRIGRPPAPAVQSLDEMEKQHIVAVLDSTEGNISRAAEILQVSRITVYAKIKKYGLQI
jgi:transcriptional regulator of acetoin/glycerol metabolism